MATFDFVKLKNQWKIHLMQKKLSEWNENDKQIAEIIGFVKKSPEEIIKSAKKKIGLKQVTTLTKLNGGDKMEKILKIICEILFVDYNNYYNL